jgi:uncharacterized membrane protein
MTTKTQARPLFAATLTPNNSLSGAGQQAVVAVAVVLASVPGMVFFSMGAWPIVGFLGLDLVAVLWALAAARRRARAYEKVTLWPDQLELIRGDGRGHETRLVFNPFFVRLVIDRDFDERTRALRLRVGEELHEFGAFLSPDDKASFAKVFGTALRKAR